MANGPKDYRDPKVTTTERSGSSMKWLWYLLGALVLLLLLGWLLGWFGGADEAAVEDGAAAGATAVEPAEGTTAVEAEPATDE